MDIAQVRIEIAKNNLTDYKSNFARVKGYRKFKVRIRAEN